MGTHRETYTPELTSAPRASWKKYPLLAVLAALFIVSFYIGKYPIAASQVITVIASKVIPLERTWTDTVEIIIFQVRLPRIVAAMVVGASLSAAGAAYQRMFKNPLVSPDILGASAGAGLGAALGIYFSLGVLGIQTMAFLVSLGAVFLTYTMSTRMRHNPILALVLTGILIGTLCSSAISLIKYTADPYDKLPAITFWLMGSLAAVTPRDVLVILPPMLLGFTPLYLTRWRLNVLTMGEEEARTMGLDTRKLRLLVILCSTLLTASAVSVSGLIGWVGLLVPHLARLIVGPNYSALLPASVLMGSIYLLLVDNLARGLTGSEIPLGILTSIMGAPFFLSLLFGKGQQGSEVGNK